MRLGSKMFVMIMLIGLAAQCDLSLLWWIVATTVGAVVNGIMDTMKAKSGRTE